MVLTVDRYGAPKYGAIGRPPAGIIAHAPEFGTTPTLANAIACAEWQATAGNTSGGSYHGILGHNGTDDPATCVTEDHWVMVRSVPWDQACGGLATSRDPAVWGPERYPWIKTLTPAAAYSDPNRWHHQIALAGRAAWFVTNGYPLGLLRALARWVIILEGAYRYNAILTLHRFWQVNRTDPGPVDLWDKVLVEYEKMQAPAPAPTPPPLPPPAPDPLAVALGRITTKDAKIKAAIAALTEALEA